MGVVARLVDRAVNRTALPGALPASDRAKEMLHTGPVVDLVVGSALFRDSFVRGGEGGHVDLPRARAIGIKIVGLTVATSWPNVAGSLSRWHFRSLGLPARSTPSRMAVAEWIIGRMDAWCVESGGALVVVRSTTDLDRCLAPGGPLGVLIGVQGAHALDGELKNVARLRERGVRMLAPAHVMDNEAVGSGTGRKAGGLTGFGRELLAELEAQHVVVDLAHMSVAGIAEALPRLRRPFVASHTGIVRKAVSVSRRSGGLRRYRAETRNLPIDLAREIGRRGGLVGVVLATRLLGGSTLDDAVAMLRLAFEAASDENVCLGSDMDGALRMVIDAGGLPALADALLDAGTDASTVRGFLGGNAVRFLRASLQ